MPKKPDPTNAERQRRYRENQRKLHERYVTGTGMATAPIRSLLKEIKRKRKQINAPRVKGRWNVDATSERELILLVEWIEAELEHMLATVVVT